MSQLDFFLQSMGCKWKKERKILEFVEILLKTSVELFLFLKYICAIFVLFNKSLNCYVRNCWLYRNT